jgi:ATP-dependent DNA ligase
MANGENDGALEGSPAPDTRRPLGQELSPLAGGSNQGGIQYREHLEGDGAAIFAHACKLGCEGIVPKHREHPYRSGPSKAWLKIKNPGAPVLEPS